MKKQFICAALLAAAGCSDIAAPSDAERIQPSTKYAAYSEEETPENQLPTFLYSVTPDAGYTSGYAYAQSIVNYFATNVLARATVTTSQGSNDAESEDYNLLPGHRDHWASVNQRMDVCTGSIQGKAYGRIWSQFPFAGSMTWGQKSDTKQDDYSCPGSTGSTSGGSSSPSTQTICRDGIVDHYWYYPETGEWEFRYSEYTTVCYPATT